MQKYTIEQAIPGQDTATRLWKDRAFIGNHRPLTSHTTYAILPIGMPIIDKKPVSDAVFSWNSLPSPNPEKPIEGRNPVLEALKADRPINKLLLSKGIGRHSVIGQILYHARRNGVLVEYVDPRLIQKLSSTGHSQGVLAMVATKEYVDLNYLLEASRQRDDLPLYIILDGIEDPHNLGAILRTADAVGVHGVIIPQRRAVGLTAAVSRTSAGAVEYIPVARVSNIPKH